MAQDIELAPKKEELKRRLDASEYKTLIEVILDGTSYLIKKLSKNPKPLPLWYSALVICIATLMIPSAYTSLLFDNLDATSRLSEPFDVIAITLTVTIIYVVIILAKIYIGYLFAMLRDYLIESIESTANLVELQHWLVRISNVKSSLIFSIIFGVIVGLYSTITLSRMRAGFLGFGPAVFLIADTFWVGVFIYHLYLFLVFSIGLSQYRLTLFAPNPSSSEVIDHLSGVLGSLVYVLAGVLAISTFIQGLAGLFPLEYVISTVLVGWIPLFALFIANQYALSKVITRAKWKELNGIQAKIEKLRAVKNIAEKETMDAIKRLLDYHNQVKGTPNSAMNIRVGLNFLNSLLLPVVTSLLANLEKVLEFFKLSN